MEGFDNLPRDGQIPGILRKTHSGAAEKPHHVDFSTEIS